MIGPSRRRRSQVAAADPLSLHLRISRRRNRARRLLAASLVALAVSLAAWLAGAGLVGHAAATLAAFVVALFLPVRGATRWALSWISGHAGFSYQTALETHGHDDPYGLHAAVSARAERQVRHLTPPRATAWWLPLLAVALGLLLLPAANLPSLGRGAADGARTSPPGASAPEQADEAIPPEPESVAPIDNPDDPQRADQPAGDGDDLGDPTDDLAGDAEGGAQGEQEILDRFLDNLREREPQTEEPNQQGAAPPNLQPSPQPADPQQGGEQQEQGDTNGETEAQPGDQAGQGEPGDETQNDGQQGQQDGAQPEDGQQEAGTEAGDDQAPAGFEPGDQPLGGNSPEGGDNPDQNGNDEGLGAGQLPSAAQDTGILEGEAQSEPELLEGQLGAGPENPAGLIRLPGREEIDLPGGFEPQSYIRAAEEAVTEGNIPVDYQEVIRNYFR